MEMPSEVYATLSAVVTKFPHTGSDEERRAAMEKVVQTIRARHGLQYVWKTEHQTLIAPSKDGMGFVPNELPAHGRLTPMYIWDTISGTSRKPNAPPLISEELRSAYVLAPEPKDWLGGATPVPTPPPPATVDLSPVLEELTAIKARLAVLERKVEAVGARTFPEYTTRFLGQTLTLTPKK